MKKLRNIKRGFLVVRRLKTEEIKSIQLQEVSFGFIMPIEIYLNYRGIEGEKWPYIEGEVFSEKDFTEILYSEAYDYYKEIKSLKSDEKIDFLYIEVGIQSESDLKGYSGFNFYGYDYGSFISPWNSYSVILNEVLFGRYKILKDAAANLNQNFLFPSLENLVALDQVRENMVIAGADLETAETDDEEPKAIAVFGR